jgi:CBS domain-containing protein
MLTEPRVSQAADSLADAGRLMARVGAGVLPVVDEGATVVGILTDRDLCCVLAETDNRASSVRVADVMQRQVWSCAATDDIAGALRTMREHKVRRLPVVDGQGHLEGLLTLDDIVMEARIFETREFHGPYYTDVVETLREIVRHSMPAPAAETR